HDFNKRASTEASQALQNLSADSSEYQALHKQIEAQRQQRLQDFAQQRQRLKEGSDLERQHIETALRAKYQIDPDFSIQSCEFFFDCFVDIGIEGGFLLGKGIAAAGAGLASLFTGQSFESIYTPIEQRIDQA